MKTEEFRQLIDRRLSSIEIDSQMRQKILQQCTLTAATKPTCFRKNIIKKVTACTAICSIVISTAFICIAASPPLQTTLARLGNEVTMLLEPIDTVSNSNGIEMDVLAAMSDEDMVVVYLTLQDTQKQNRVDDTIQIIDFATKSQRLAKSELLFSNINVLWYDEQTQTATLRLIGQSMHGVKNSKISLDIHSFLSGKSYGSMISTNYTLADVLAYNPNPSVSYPSKIDSYSCSGDLMEQLEKTVNMGKMPVLSKNSEVPITIPNFSWFEIENMAVLNNMLHTRVAYDRNMGRFKLMDTNSHKEVEPSQLTLQLETFNPDDTHYYTAIEEQILTIPENCLFENIEIWGNVISYNNYVEGNWNTTFKIEDAKTKSKTVNCHIEMNPWIVNKIEISPIGLTIYGEGEMLSDSSPVSIEIYQKDGSLVEYNGSSSSVEKNFIKLKQIFETPIDIDTIDRVVIDENVIQFDS